MVPLRNARLCQVLGAILCSFDVTPGSDVVVDPQGTVYANGEPGMLYAVDPNKGSVKWLNNKVNGGSRVMDSQNNERCSR
jgi:outer membrane protein assembly factor BamB